MKKKNIILISVLLGALLLLTGCSMDPSQNTDGFFSTYLIQPFTSFIMFVAKFVGVITELRLLLQRYLSVH